MKPIVIGATLKAPIFRVSPIGLQTRLAYLLPTPRTLAGFLASNLGRYLRLNPEQEIERTKLRENLMWDVIASKMVLTCRPKRWVTKFQATIKVWLLERRDIWRKRSESQKNKEESREEGEEKVEETVGMDALKTEYVICDELVFYAVFDSKKLCKALNRYVLRKIKSYELDQNEIPEILVKALRLSERIGDSESLVVATDSKQMRIERVGKAGAITTVTPKKWLSNYDEIERIMPMPTTPLIAGRKINMRKNISEDMVLPLKPEFSKFLYYKYSEFEAEAENQHSIIFLENGDSIVIPNSFFGR